MSPSTGETKELCMHLVNLTPHAIRILCEGAEELVLPPDGRVARVATHALRWDARPRIAVADSPQWFAPAHHESHAPALQPRAVALATPPGGRMPGDRPAPRQWNSNKPGRKLTRLRRNREMVP